MLLLPLVVIAVAAYAVYRIMHRQPQLATGVVAAPDAVPVSRAPFWPTTIEGRISIGAFALNFAPLALVNVIAIPFLGWILIIAALALSGVARFVKHDRSTSVLIVFVVTALGTLGGLLFLGGEVFIGHD